jgi:AcrR family transcriptional regulator
MVTAARTPRSSWIEEGLRALASGGPDGVRIEVLAQTLGVSRGGFYWHFADRGALLNEILDRWERSTTDEIIDQVERAGGSARAKLRRTFELTSSGEGILDVDLAVRGWARRDEAVAERLHRLDNRRMDYLRSLFRTFCSDPRDVEARCLLSFSLLIGNHFISADHGRRSRQQVLAAALKELGR